MTSADPFATFDDLQDPLEESFPASVTSANAPCRCGALVSSHRYGPCRDDDDPTRQ